MLANLRTDELPATSGAEVVPLPTAVGDAELVRALRTGQPWAKKVFFDRHAQRVERLLVRVLGPDDEIADLVHEVFLAALESLVKLQDPSALGSWLNGIAVFMARGTIRRRRRRRWLELFAPSDLPEQEARVTDPAVSEALRATYEVLEQLPADDRIVFSLRMIDGMELSEVAVACQVSLATIKRRLARAKHSFSDRARLHPALAEWCEGAST